ncbi:NEL-type E3 ubiquitin ligase domain-containing protein [Pseudomonas fluorescens]|nr:NEL-type E3 ubiquitin ligase domain-containing protein [Pseudomonas fluorescens]
MTTASNSDHERLASANKNAWSAQTSVDRLLANLKDVYSFAEPLLKARLREKYNVEVDVKNTYLILYATKKTPWYVIDTSKGYTARTVSLLDAALHNFSSNETYEADSGFITQPDNRGLFDILPLKEKITVGQFQALCRELDIGSQYKKHLEIILLSKEPVSEAMLQLNVQRSQQTALKAAAHMAWMRKDISRSAHALIIELLNGSHNLVLDGQVMQACELGMMDLTLTGILLIRPDPEQIQRSKKVIAYLPHDPDHPLKEYESSIDFMKELTRQLRDNRVSASTKQSYRQYFSQFVDHEQRGHFFAGLEQRLTIVKWHAKEPTDSRPSWRETPVDRPNLQYSALPITQPLWTWIYQRQLNKILNDARGIAVPTADADSNARWAWWENFKRIVSDIFNAALMVLMPFVPGLGELMLVYTAYQLTHDVIEGVVDLAEGLWEEGAKHIVSVASDVVQLIAFAAGAKIAGEFQLAASAFIERMKPVRLPNGERRLWNPDITAYEHKNLRLPEHSRPDALGLHRHEGKDVLPLDDRLYVVQKESGLDRLQHPARPEAYAPKMAHNGRGAWTHEGENPQTWDSPALMKRLGHSTEGLSLAQLENIRLISGTHEDALRRMHVDNAPPPLLLDDTLKRFRAFEDVGVTSQQVRSGRPMDPPSNWFEQLVTELPGWPSDCALKVYERSDLSGMARTYGSAQPTRTLSLGLADVMEGKLPDNVVDFLDEAQLAQLLGSRLPKQERTQALRDCLADLVDGRKAGISDDVYRFREASNDPRVRQLQHQYPDLPTAIADRLVAHATKSELDTLTGQRRIPLSLKGRARECAFETRSTRAIEGLYQNDLLTPDTERLALNVLRLYSDTYSDLRIEVRGGAQDGPMRCSVGLDDATNVRLLLRDEQGRYEVHDGNQRKLFEADDLYESILRAMPDRSRRELGYAPGQGNAFKQWLKSNARLPADRRTALLEPAIRPVPELDTDLLLRGPLLSRPPLTIEQRVEDLYPHLSKREVATFVSSLPADKDPVEVLTKLDVELNELRNTFDAWKQQMAPVLPDEAAVAPDAVKFISERLLECFQRKSRVFNERSTRLEGGYTLDLSTEFLSHDLERWWKKLPDIKKYLDQITTLSLDSMRFSQGSGGLLKDFTLLRQFSARRCNLTRLPEGVHRMHFLETLRLDDNRIELTPTSVEQLRNLTRMQTLRLDHNPLGRVPNVERMPRLKVLSLAHTGIEAWPDGLFNKHRPRGFFLELQGNPIRTVPDAAPGSHEAWILARARLSPDKLLAPHREALFDYRQSVGLHRQNLYDPLANNARAKWPLSDDSLLWGRRSMGLGTYRVEAWDNLMTEPNATDFFRIIDHLTTSADYRAGGPTREQLSRRVWDLIDAMDLDTQLREKLFGIAEHPEDCTDASSEIFNTMGIEALASQAYAYSTSNAELEVKLVKLAKGATRLDRVNEIARADVMTRPSREEEVEVYLAYQTHLAQRLGLPWQSETMLHRNIAGVSDSAIDRACETVLSREEGDGLVNGMLENAFWDKYLRDTYPNALAANDRYFNRQMGLLEDSLAGSDGEAMTEQAYSAKVSDLGYKRLDLGRRLTRTLMKKHEL